MAKVVLNQVSKRFSSQVAAVSDLDLEVADQEFLVLVGPSGCGKTTTLRMIAGLEEVSGGNITIGDRNVTHVSPKDRDIAMVFQNYALYPHMTVRRNLSFGLDLRYGGNFLSRVWRHFRDTEKAKERLRQYREIPQKVEQTATALGIGHLLGRYPRELSGGERQRVALGRAIVRQPAAFLFDEPLSNLDAKLRVEMRRELKQLHRRLGATMIYVTHDQVEAMTLGDRIAVMNQGALQQIGTPDEVYHRPVNRFVASFLGTPAMNLLEGELIDNDGILLFRSPGVELVLGRDQVPGDKSGQVVLGVRPEDVRVITAATDQQVPEMGPEWALVANGEVTLVESLGDLSYVHVNVWDTPLTSRAGQIAPPETTTVFTAKASHLNGDRPSEKSPVVLAVRPAALHWFDQASGERVADR